jgi:hypothetical protein
VEPITIGSSETFQPFFELSLKGLGIEVGKELTPETWANEIRAHAQKGKRPVLLVDEAGNLMKLDRELDWKLGNEMRALQNNGNAEFYLAGQDVLHQATIVHGGPFRNFADKITLKGLEELDSVRLIQEPMRRIGFEVATDHARRIHKGTAGVPVLIQEFCIRLLNCHLLPSRAEIDELSIAEIEQDPEYLGIVQDYFEYGLVDKAKAIMTIAAMRRETTRSEIMAEWSRRGSYLSRYQLDKQLSILIRFGVLEQDRRNHSLFKISPGYLAATILGDEPEALLDEYISGTGTREE